MVDVPIFVGDLSRADAAYLSRVARSCVRVLEHGAGGSTQIFAQSVPAGIGRVWSVEPDPRWREATAARVEELLGDTIAGRCDLSIAIPQDWDWCDLVFVDGPAQHRLSFASVAWPILKVGGLLLWHDGRRERDWDQIAHFLCGVHAEVEVVQVCPDATNMIAIRKRAPVLYQDWNVSEGKPEWQIGRGAIPADWVEQLGGRRPCPSP